MRQESNYTREIKVESLQPKKRLKRGSAAETSTTTPLERGDSDRRNRKVIARDGEEEHALTNNEQTKRLYGVCYPEIPMGGTPPMH